MALTYLDSTIKSEGDTWTVIANMTPDTSYVSGGYYIDPVQVRLTRIQDVIVPNNLDGYAYDFDKTTGKLKISSGSGGSGVIVGAPLPTHTHTTSVQVEDITVNSGTYVALAGPAGVFLPGEDVVGSLSGTTVTNNATGAGTSERYLHYNDLFLRFWVGETLTGVTSGQIKVCEGLSFRVYEPAGQVVSCHTAFNSDTVTHYRTLHASATPVILYTFMISAAVGGFGTAELITGGTSGCVGRIRLSNSDLWTKGTLFVELLSGAAAFTLGETITGSSSGATAVIDAFWKQPLFYHNTTLNRFEVPQENVSNTISFLTQYNTMTSVSAGTPSGTITVTPSAFAELPNGTDVRAIIPNINAIITGW